MKKRLLFVFLIYLICFIFIGCKFNDISKDNKCIKTQEEIVEENLQKVKDYKVIIKKLDYEYLDEYINDFFSDVETYISENINDFDLDYKVDRKISIFENDLKNEIMINFNEYIEILSDYPSEFLDSANAELIKINDIGIFIEKYNEIMNNIKNNYSIEYTKSLELYVDTCKENFKKYYSIFNPYLNDSEIENLEKEYNEFCPSLDKYTSIESLNYYVKKEEKRLDDELIPFYTDKFKVIIKSISDNEKRKVSYSDADSTCKEFYDRLTKKIDYVDNLADLDKFINDFETCNLDLQNKIYTILNNRRIEIADISYNNPYEYIKKQYIPTKNIASEKSDSDYSSFVNANEIETLGFGENWMTICNGFNKIQNALSLIASQSNLVYLYGHNAIKYFASTEDDLKYVVSLDDRVFTYSIDDSLMTCNVEFLNISNFDEYKDVKTTIVFRYDPVLDEHISYLTIRDENENNLYSIQTSRTSKHYSFNFNEYNNDHTIDFDYYFADKMGIYQEKKLIGKHYSDYSFDYNTFNYHDSEDSNNSYMECIQRTNELYTFEIYDNSGKLVSTSSLNSDFDDLKVQIFLPLVDSIDSIKVLNDDVYINGLDNTYDDDKNKYSIKLIDKYVVVYDEKTNKNVLSKFSVPVLVIDNVETCKYAYTINLPQEIIDELDFKEFINDEGWINIWIR